ncbi:MAG: minor capsid protein [Clostridium sp.]|nr:minor capsid protein [Clostridium sp.]
MFEIELNILSPKQQLKKLGIDENGDAQKFFTNELMRLSNRYLPFQSGMLQASARMSSKGDAIIYNTPYARALWYGKVMVDPVTGASGFFIPNVGWRSRKNVQKVVSNRDMTFNDAPTRGSHWVTRCYMDNKYALTKATAKYIKEHNNGNY